ncbi:MAG TPA: Hpt domain-containing protein [Pirellulaceae bacterium]|nr:Hpt domain-containing protein [Pirellulaceae bacterium]HMO91834.1 Hpt domain-containing protein [Pirellulaceae bacterium]HMP69897.1 Hpt domain-containing protein [Pirellulaceae bacterium]
MLQFDKHNFTPESEHDAPIDRDELLKRCLGEADFALSIVEQFLDNWNRDYRQLEDTVAERLSTNNPLPLKQTAHRLRGTAATIAAKNLAHKLGQLEASVAMDDVAFYRHALEELNHEVKRVSRFASESLSHS